MHNVPLMQPGRLEVPVPLRLTTTSVKSGERCHLAAAKMLINDLPEWLAYRCPSPAQVLLTAAEMHL